MNYLIWFTALLIIISKFFDCWTTSTQIVNIEQERNPFARKLMYKYGAGKVIWGVFVLTILIVITALVIMFGFHNNTLYKVTFIVIGLIISVFQFAVAKTNKTKELNFITKILLKKYYG